MIIKFHPAVSKDPTLAAQCSMNYTLGLTTGSGIKRIAVPQQLDGPPPAVFVDAAAEFGRHSKHPVSLCVISYGQRCEPTIRQKIWKEIVNFVGAGIAPHDRLTLLVGHVTGDAGTEGDAVDDHGYFLNHLLGPGLRWQPYYRKADRASLTALQEHLNHKYGLISPRDPARLVRIRVRILRNDSAMLRDWKSGAEKLLTAGIKEGWIKNRTDILEALFGHHLIKTFRGWDKFSEVEIPGCGRVSLRGPAFQQSFDAKTYLAQREKWVRKEALFYESETERLRDARLKIHQARFYPTTSTQILWTKPVALARLATPIADPWETLAKSIHCKTGSTFPPEFIINELKTKRAEIDTIAYLDNLRRLGLSLAHHSDDLADAGALGEAIDRFDPVARTVAASLRGYGERQKQNFPSGAESGGTTGTAEKDRNRPSFLTGLATAIENLPRKIRFLGPALGVQGGKPAPSGKFLETEHAIRLWADWIAFVYPDESAEETNSKSKTKIDDIILDTPSNSFSTSVLTHSSHEFT